MGAFLSQTNFTAGEWSPLLDGRTDLDKYKNAVRQMKNFIPLPHGPAAFRPGLKYISGTKHNAKNSVLIPFIFSVSDALDLEFGDYYIRFYKSGAQLKVGGVAYEVISPYAAADVAEIKYCQSADVLYLTHHDYAPRKLSREADTNWTLSIINFNSPPTSELAFKPDSTLVPAAVTGTGVSFTSGENIFLSGDVGRIIRSGASRATITAFNAADHVTCDIIDDFNSTAAIISGMWEMLGSPSGSIYPSVCGPVGRSCTITGTGASETITEHFANEWIASPALGATFYYLGNTGISFLYAKPDRVYQSGALFVEGILLSLGLPQWAWGDADTLGYSTVYIRTLSDPTNIANPLHSAVVAAAPDIFRAADVGKYIRLLDGCVKITGFNSASSLSAVIIQNMTDVDEDADDDSSTTPSDNHTRAWTLESAVWNATDGYPTCCTFYEDRLFFARGENIRGSQTGDYENFATGVTDSDGIDFSLNARMFSSIVWMEPREYLIIGTKSGEWRVGPEDSGSALTPLNVVAKQHTQYGCADIMPLTIGNCTLFVQKALRKLREFTSNPTSVNIEYVAPDLTLLAEHITESGIAGLCYQQEPYSIVWMYLTDGTLIGMTYLRDQDVIALHEHPTTGHVESMAVIPASGYDQVSMIVERTINGSIVRNVETLAPFFSDDAATFTANNGLNAFFVDCGATYSGAAATSITGGGHLEGETVAVVADGAYVGTKVIAAGAFTLTTAASVVHFGLPYTGTLETMRPEIGLRDGTAQGRLKQIFKLVLRLLNSATFKCGRDTTHLEAVILRATDDATGEEKPLFTGDQDVSYESAIDRDARIMIVQDKPLPVTVVAIYPEVEMS